MNEKVWNYSFKIDGLYCTVISDFLWVKIFNISDFASKYAFDEASNPSTLP